MPTNSRFQPKFKRTYVLNRSAAKDAIRAYNSDPSVARDEEKVYQQLGLGFHQGKVFEQIRALCGRAHIVQGYR